MNALLTQQPGFWLIITDETGPLQSMSVRGSWRDFDDEKRCELARGAFPGLTVLSTKYAENPRDYTFADDVLLVSIPGTHEVAQPKPRRKVRKAPVVVREPDEDPGEYELGKRYWTYQGTATVLAAQRELDDTKVIHTCSCGATYTERTWAALDFCGADDRREGDTIIHEVMRHCVCGSTRMVATTRVAGGGR